MNATLNFQLLTSLRLASSKGWFSNNLNAALADILFLKIIKIENDTVYINEKLTNNEMDLLCQTGAVPNLQNPFKVVLKIEN